MNDVDLVHLVRQGKFFGMVRCDIEVPECDRERWADMPPIFKNVEVSINDIGPLMAAFCRRNDLMKTPRRTLISSYTGVDIMLGTPLLKWYLDHDLKVTRIYEAFEFKPKACFADFIQRAVEVRRKADADPTRYAVKGEFEKLKVIW